MKALTQIHRLLISALILFALSVVLFAQTGSAISAGTLTSRAVMMPKPVVPPAARALGASGTVNVQVTIDEIGKVITAAAISGHPLLRKAAEEAAMQAEFKPFMRRGKAVRAVGVLSYDFSASDKNEGERTSDNEGAIVSVPTKSELLRTDGKPTAHEIKVMLEEKFTSIYEDHYCCKEKNKVEFEWLAPVELGGQQSFGSIPVPCWAARIDVKVTYTKVSSGETGHVRRGINGNPVKEGFCIYKDAYDKWTYMTYAP